MAMEAASVAFFEQHGFIVDLDEVRAGTDHQGERARVPGWLVEDREAWALVPLLHFERLVGMVVLGRPPVTRQLDWEDFDLLRVVGQQLASYLAENNGQVALLEANRFDEFNRRIAFVMHDIKNLASQLSLLSRNAERHAENPAFRADMLVTLRNSTDKLNACSRAFRAMARPRRKSSRGLTWRTCARVSSPVMPGRKGRGRTLSGKRPSAFWPIAKRWSRCSCTWCRMRSMPARRDAGAAALAHRGRRGASTWSIPARHERRFVRNGLFAVRFHQVRRFRHRRLRSARNGARHARAA
jgi:hypothetical protein